MTPVDPALLAQLSEAEAVGAISAALLEWRLASIDAAIKEIDNLKLEARIIWLERELKRRERSINRLWTAIFTTIGTVLAGILIYFFTADKAHGSEVLHFLHSVISY